jgi:hypothetical protein
MRRRRDLYLSGPAKVSPGLGNLRVLAELGECHPDGSSYRKLVVRLMQFEDQPPYLLIGRFCLDQDAEWQPERTVCVVSPVVFKWLLSTLNKHKAVILSALERRRAVDDEQGEGDEAFGDRR